MELPDSLRIFLDAPPVHVPLVQWLEFDEQGKITKEWEEIKGDKPLGRVAIKKA